MGKFIGSDNPNWRGGYKPRYYPAGFSRFKKVFLRMLYNNTCPNCGLVSASLPVHHIDSNKAHNKINNLIPLCRACHNKTRVKDVIRRKILRIHYTFISDGCLRDMKFRKLYCGGDVSVPIYSGPVTVTTNPTE